MKKKVLPHKLLQSWRVIQINTYTNSYTYTRTRIGVIDDHFELFLTCAEMSKNDIKKILEAVDNKELSAVGIYIEDNNYRIAEVEFEIDWDEHQHLIGVYGTQFDTDLPGWDNGVSPEAYVAAQRLVAAAKQMGKPVRSWISVSPSVYDNPAWHKAVCDNLGYSCGSTVPPWKDEPITQSRSVTYLPEAKITQRIAR